MRHSLHRYLGAFKRITYPDAASVVCRTAEPQLLVVESGVLFDGRYLHDAGSVLDLSSGRLGDLAGARIVAVGPTVVHALSLGAERQLKRELGPAFETSLVCLALELARRAGGRPAHRAA